MAGHMPMESLLDQLRSQSRSQQTPSQPQSSGQFSHQQQQQQRQQSPHHLNAYQLLLQQQQHLRDIGSPTQGTFQQQGPVSNYQQNYGFPSPQYIQQLGGQNAFYSSSSPHPQAMSPAYMQSPNQTQRGDGDGRSTNLLHLLKGSAGASHDGNSRPSGSPGVERGNRAQQAESLNTLQTAIPSSNSPALISPSMNPQDLVATLLGKVTSPPTTSKEDKPRLLESQTSGDQTSRSQKLSEAGLDGQQRNLLHEILGRSKPEHDEADISSVPPGDGSTEGRLGTPRRGSEDTSGRMPEIPQALRDLANSTLSPPDASDHAEDNNKESDANSSSSLQAKPMFTYVNPFDQLHATSPRNRTPKPAQQRPSAAISMAMETNSGNASPVPPTTAYSPQPQTTGDGTADSFLPETEKYDQDLHQFVDVGRHTPPLQEPYVEAVQEPGDDEVDPFEEEIDPFEDVEDADEPEERNAPEGTQALNGEAENGDNHPDTVEQPPSEDRNEATAPDPKIPEGPNSEHQPDRLPETKEVTDPPPLKVYNFPMKPFSLITIKPISDSPSFAETKFSDIARMTRTLDQLDRNLISASGKYIVYAMSKAKGGVRVIRQEDGQDMVLMKDNSDKVVHVMISKEDRVIATGSSGAVLWGKMQNSDFDDGKPFCFVFPPSDQQDQNGGLTKSRAHKSSRHEDIFAIGRGRSIHIISAEVASNYVSEDYNTNEVDEKSYFAKYNRVIDTGKVSKDFCFSEDDTAIISVDKAGKIKLWDIEQLGQFDTESSQEDQSHPVLKEPLTLFSAISTGESYKATSIMFLDKLKPYQKGLALRYVLVGLRQNHTLQLWDLAIGRPVQELQFPQESQTDALCSVAYHPPTGIIVVGNPTRNSIYFVHLSAPRYNLPNISQTEYARAINTKSPILPKVDATAIMSGLREYSFGSKGQLISLDILDVMPMAEDVPLEGEESTLFELYVAHSKGMTCLTIMREDLGWDKDSKAKVSVDGVREGICEVSPLPATVVEVAPKATESQETQAAASSSRPEPEPQAKSILKPAALPTPTPVAQNKKKAPVQPAASASVVPLTENVTDKVDDKYSSDTGRDRKLATPSKGKKAKKEQSIPIPPIPPVFTPTSEANNPLSPKKKEKSKEKEREKTKDEPKAAFGITPDFLDREIRKIETAVSAEFTKVLDKEMTTLYQKIDDERRVQQASGDAKHEAVLRMMSSSLVSGMEKVLSKLISNDIESKVMPQIDSSIAKSLQDMVPTAMAAQVSTVVPEAVKKSLLGKDFVQQITSSVTDSVKREMDKSIKATLAPALEKMSTETTKLISAEVSKKTRDALKEAKKVHDSDTAKIQQLTDAVTEMTKAFTILENNVASLIQQAKFQPDIQDTPTSATPPQHQAPPPKQLTEEEVMLIEIEKHLSAQNYEGGILAWLQSKEKQDVVFNNIMFRHDPRIIIPSLSVVVVLTVAASVTGNFDTKLSERLDWLETCLNDLAQVPIEDQSRVMIPRIMAVIISRLQQYYMAFAEDDPTSPMLKRIAACSRASNALIKAVVA